MSRRIERVRSIMCMLVQRVRTVRSCPTEAKVSRSVAAVMVGVVISREHTSEDGKPCCPPTGRPSRGLQQVP